MIKLIDFVNAYLDECDWKDLTLIKFCLCALGLFVGLMIPKNKKKLLAVISIIAFAVSFIPLMLRFLKKRKC